MANDFKLRSAQSIATFCTDLLQLVPSGEQPNPLDMDAEARANLVTVSARLAAGIAAQNIAESAAKSATREKGYALNAAVYELNAIAGNAMTGGVSDTVLERYGFAPRPSRTTRPAAPNPVSGLVAVPRVDGTVRLTWDRSGNRKSTSFIIERSADGQAWTQVGSTLSTKATLDGFDPGMTAYFRVVATNSVGVALPSVPAGIYAPLAPATPMLRVA